ncbi:hypothetical protein ACHWQZ_G007854 [Mnemiopsis leidyi]
MYMYKATAGIWCTLSFFIVAGSIIAFFTPFWLVAPNNAADNVTVSDKNFIDAGELTVDAHAACGMMSYCVPYTYHPLNDSFLFSKDAHMQRCPLYTNFDDIPTIFGKVSAVMFAAGCVILLISWIFSAISLCYGYLCDVSTYLLISVVQLFCLIINGVAILLWTLSWDQTDFKCVGEGYCGTLSQFDTGRCEMGWAFLLGLASTGSILLAVFVGCLSFFLQKQKDES